MRTALRVLLFALLSVAYTFALAESSIRLTTFPTLASVADGRSTVSVKAEVRDQNGRAVPDGTTVLFECDLATTRFREQTVGTVGGVAFATLVAGTVAGVAHLTASALTVGASPATLTYEFVSDRSQLSSAKEYIEIVSPGYMQYGYVSNAWLIAAADPNGKVSLRYRDITVTATDIQYSLPLYELRARKAVLKIGKFEQKFDDLYLVLNSRDPSLGFGTTTFRAKRTNQIVTQGMGLALVRQDPNGNLSIPPDEDRYGLVDIHRGGITPSALKNPASFFTFESMIRAPSTISARKAIIFPRRKVQFQNAAICVAGQTVMRVPLYEFTLATATPLVTEQMLAVNNSQVELNYPYFLSMRPGETSLLRFRTGNQYGRTDTSDTGVFLDYELHWDHGDDMQGNFVFSGIGRNDWTVGVDQYLRIDDRTSASAQLFSPTGRAYLGTASVSHQFNGFSVGMNGDVSRTVEGIPFTSADYSATIAKDPIKVGHYPFKIYLELTGTSAYNQLINETQSGAGARSRLQSNPLPIDRNTSVTTSFTTSYLIGKNELHSLQYLGSVAMGHRFSKSLSTVLTYNYTRDGFNEYVIGEHQLTLQTNYNIGPASLSVAANKSLDVERRTVFADLDYKFSKLWRIKTGYTYDRYLNDSYIDYNYGFGYRIGWREVGLIWSEQTRRIGFQFLGTTVF